MVLPFLKENADAERVSVSFLMMGPGRKSRAFFCDCPMPANKADRH